MLTFTGKEIPEGMSDDRIVEHNKKIEESLIKIRIEYEKAKKQIKDGLIAPCKRCQYEGYFRCYACSESLYEGFNIKDYPY